jgi:hypothetical protein
LSSFADKKRLKNCKNSIKNYRRKRISKRGKKERKICMSCKRLSRKKSTRHFKKIRKCRKKSKYTYKNKDSKIFKSNKISTSNLIVFKGFSVIRTRKPKIIEMMIFRLLTKVSQIKIIVVEIMIGSQSIKVVQR